jgi:hypothetical protein
MIGNDSNGRPIVVAVGKNLPEKGVDLERVLLYLIKFMDPLVERRCSIGK